MPTTTNCTGCPSRIPTVLARGRRRSRDRVLAAVDAGARRLARARVVDVVRRRAAEPRLELRPPLARAPRRGRGLARRGRSRSALTWPELSRQVTQVAEALVELGVRRGGPGGDLPADVPRGRGGVARVCAHRRRAGARLLGLRGAGDRRAAGGLGRQGGDLRRPLLPAREARGHARHARGGERRRRRGARLEPRRGLARARDEAARHARARGSIRRRRTSSRTRRAPRAGRRERCTSRAASSSPSRARSRTRPT